MEYEVEKKYAVVGGGLVFGVGKPKTLHFSDEDFIWAEDDFGWAEEQE